ncbi:MAG: two-component sensor histidine kinase [Gammaproteobacteria bacterium]|nr:two-component sensor histidine kinase [Gammaproteobacteria bacterium]
MKRPLSLRLRLLLAAALVLLLFLSGTGVILDRAFRTSIEESAREQLRLRALALLGTADVVGDRLTLPVMQAEPRLNQPGSGLYAGVIDGDGREVWLSRSLVGRRAGLDVPRLPPGHASFESLVDAEGVALYRFSLGVIWESSQGDVPYVFTVAMAQAPFMAEAQSFRRALFTGLGGAGLGLLLVLLAVLAAALRPLKRLALEVERVERGTAQRLDDTWPAEIAGLARNLNMLVDHERSRQQRYRNTLDDLAHSLKTPLAILRNALADGPAAADLAREQIERMQTMVHHHLQRASVSRNPLQLHRTPLAQPVQRILAGLERLHPEAGLKLSSSIPESLAVAVDERDVYEIIGNLAENACKYGHRQVQIRGEHRDGAVVLTVADDGPGVPEALREAVLHRGARADTNTSGQGIGLAVVAELLEAWDGRLAIDTDPELGGAAVSVTLPAA